MIQSQVTILNSLFHSFYFTYSQEVVGILRFSPGYNVSNVSRCSRTKMPSPTTFLPTRARRYASTVESSFRVRQTWTSMSERTTSSALTWSHRRTNFLEIKSLDKYVTISSKITLAVAVKPQLRNRRLFVWDLFESHSFKQFNSVCPKGIYLHFFSSFSNATLVSCSKISTSMGHT